MVIAEPKASGRGLVADAMSPGIAYAKKRAAS
jgi:hypothetical protein